MNQKIIFILLFVCFVFNTNAQTMHNFTVTDSDGNVHKLYENYLNNGKTVVIKFFFTTCPPCIAIAPQWQQKYVAWGSGMNDVQFIEPSVLNSDTNTKVKTYKTTYGLTLPGIGSDGSASAIVAPFQSGTYGGWYGTPSFAVIAPNKTIQFPVLFGDLDAAIAATGAVKPGTMTQPTTFNLTNNSGGFNIGTNHIKFYVKPKNADTPKLEIIKNAQGIYTFQYPTIMYPSMTEPIVIMESVAPDLVEGISSLDLVLIQKHILGLTPFTTDAKKIAADANSDNLISSLDIIVIRKLILGLITDFPNNTPSYKSIPPFQPITETAGSTKTVSFEIVKIGNVN